jgi:hypothetical protein
VKRGGWAETSAAASKAWRTMRWSAGSRIGMRRSSSERSAASRARHARPDCTCGSVPSPTSTCSVLPSRPQGPSAESRQVGLAESILQGVQFVAAQRRSSGPASTSPVRSSADAEGLEREAGPAGTR